MKRPSNPPATFSSPGHAAPSRETALAAHPQHRAHRVARHDGHRRPPRTSARLVPPRSARFRSRGAPRGAQGRADRLLRVRVRPRDPGCAAAARRPARRVHPRRRRRTRPGARRARRRADRAPRTRARRDRRARGGTRRGRRLREPRLRAGGARPRRRRRAGSRRPRHRVRDAQGPRDLRARRGAVAVGQAVLRVHAVPERVAADADAVPPEVVSRRAARPRARASAGRGRRRDPGARDDGLRAHQPARGGRRAGHGGRRRARGGLPHAHRRVPRRPRLPRRQGSFVPVRAPALRHGVDPRACRIRARPFARAGRRRRRDVAVRARLAGLLRADPLAPPARRPRELQARVRAPRVPERSRRSSPRGAAAPPAIRSSTPRCGS